MGSFSFVKNIYFLAIVVLSGTIALIMMIQTQNEWYVPQHPSCGSVEYEVEFCSNSQTVEAEITIPRDYPDLLFRDGKDKSLGDEVLAGRSTTVELNRSQSIEIIPYVESYKCSRESTTIQSSQIQPC